MAVFWIAIFGFCFYSDALELLFFYWFIPLLTTFQMISWFIEMAEHFPIVHNQKEIEKSWNRFGNKLELFFTGMHKENYHLIHHLMPHIPFWNLSKAHKIMLKYEEYKKLNQNMGGIFSTSNSAPSLWKKILKHSKKKGFYYAIESFSEFYERKIKIFYF